MKKLTCEWDVIQASIVRGHVVIQCSEHEHECLLIEAALSKGRDVNSPEVEFRVIGPKEAFVESIDVNLNLIRKRFPIPNLQVKELIIGKLSKTRVVICYIDGITNEEYVNTITQRIKDLEFDIFADNTIFIQMIEDNSNTIFPQLIETERPDRLAYALGIGQVAVMMDGSPNAVIEPAKLGWFFIANEDYYLPWHMGTFYRVLRYFAVLFSVIATPGYVAV